MLLSKKIKIEVSEQDAATLEYMQGKCRSLYNWWVMRLRAGERWPGWKRAKKTLQASRRHDPDLNAVYGKLLHEVYFRLDHAVQGFFRRLAEGEKKPGFPRVKPRHQFFTLCYPAMYLEVEGSTITLPTGGGGNWGPKRFPNIVAHLTEPPPAHFREVAVSRDARGNYYCSFVYDDAGHGDKDDEHKPRKRREKRMTQPMRDDGIVALDLGIKTLATGYTDQGAFTTSAASRATAGTTSNSTRFDPSGTAARRSPAGISTSPKCTDAFQNASGANNATVCTKPPISSLANWLKGLLSLAIFPNGRWSSKSKSTRPSKKSASGSFATAWCIMTGTSTASCRCLSINVCALGKNSL